MAAERNKHGLLGQVVDGDSIGEAAGGGYGLVVFGGVAHDADDAPEAVSRLAGGAVDQLLAVAGVHGELDAADEVAYGVEGLLVGDYVVGLVEHVSDLGRKPGGVAVAEGGDVQGALTELEKNPGPSLDAAADRAESHFTGLDLDKPWDCVHRFDADAGTEGTYKADALDRFDHDYRDFARLMDQYLPQPEALAYIDRLKRLTIIRAFARTTFLREDSRVDWPAVGTKVKQLLDTRIGAEVRELMTPVSILDGDFERKIEGLPHDEARASVMEHALRAQINERVAENPALYERLSEALERIIRQLHEQVIDAAESCKQMANVLNEIEKADEIALRYGLTPVALAVYLLLAEAAQTQTANGNGELAVAEDAPGFGNDVDERLKGIAESIEESLRAHQSVVDWRENSDVLREMRRDVKRRLRDDGRFQECELDELASRIVEVSRPRAS